GGKTRPGDAVAGVARAIGGVAGDHRDGCADQYPARGDSALHSGGARAFGSQSFADDGDDRSGEIWPPRAGTRPCTADYLCAFGGRTPDRSSAAVHGIARSEWSRDAAAGNAADHADDYFDAERSAIQGPGG